MLLLLSRGSDFVYAGGVIFYAHRSGYYVSDSAIAVSGIRIVIIMVFSMKLWVCASYYSPRYSTSSRLLLLHRKRERCVLHSLFLELTNI